MTASLSADEYRELIQAALPISTDADTVDPEPRTLFTPDSHRLALDPDVTVVRGARGVGKTVWFKALQDGKLRALAANDYQLARLKSVETLAGYGTELRPDSYPGPASLGRMLEDGTAPYDIWMMVLLRALGTPGIQQPLFWPERVRWLRDHPDEQDEALATADQRAGEGKATRLILFDALDRLHTSREQANRLIEGILRLALELRTRTRNLRAKVFIRPDMFDSPRLHFADASKLTSNAADLTWSVPNLYGLFFHQLGNAESPHASTFRSATGVWQPAEDNRYLLPRNLMGDQDVQREVFTGIAGQWMGANHRRGHTYTWLPNHLMDGIGQTSPRSFLRALTSASEDTRGRFAGYQYALHWDGIKRGVQTASRTRVAEVAEDLPWVQTAMKP
ncbi:MAG TPA: hypothetical protein VMV07_02500, partial [Streptosporangiaceae bacterium]|nr:hypothetical protein [Streptosporangiaceae bacterium]